MEIHNFNISAPGKVILHGEHSVVYGKLAIATAISMRNHLFFKTNSSNSICLIFNDLDLTIKLEVTTVNDLFIKLTEDYPELTTNWNQTLLLENLRKFLSEKLLIPADEGRNFKTSLVVFYLLCRIFLSQNINQLRQGFTFEMKSDFKIGAGLGSSASFAVSIATAFYIFSRGEQMKDSALTDEEKITISNWAFESEKIMHGNPSGIDNTICTFGGVVRFKKTEPVQRMLMKCDLNILLVDTKVARSTAKMVEYLAKLKEDFPKLIDNVMTALDECANQAALVYENGIIEKNTKIDMLTKLFETNNGLLRALGVSHYKLEEIFLIAKKHDLASKLTGAGGGGYAIILLPDNYNKTDNFQYLCNDLDKAGFDWSEATIGDVGVSVNFADK